VTPRPAEARPRRRYPEPVRVRGLANRGVWAVAAVLAAAAVGGCGDSHVTDVPLNGKGAGGQEGSPKAVWGKPTTGERPIAVVMLIHGGGWAGLNPEALQITEASAPVFQRQGYETVTVDYRKGAQGIYDVQRFYKQARERFGPKMPICATGPSAGGHISLMLAVWNPDLRCVIDLSGPTDLTTLASQPNGAEGNRIAEEAFGGTRLFEKFSPALHADSICARVLMVFAQNDPIVPVAQGYELAKALPDARLIVLPPGDAPFVHAIPGAGPHSGVDEAAKAQAAAEQAQFLSDAVSSPPPACSR
jgi:acetyl esterase/lipase